MKGRDPRPVSEHAIHIAIVELLALKAHRQLIWWHCPNGEDRPALVGAKLRKMGTLPGVADLCFVLPPDGKAAFMEIKGPSGRASVEQMAFAERCAGVGAPYAICRSLDQAEATLSSWGALRERREAA